MGLFQRPPSPDTLQLLETGRALDSGDELALAELEAQVGILDEWDENELTPNCPGEDVSSRKRILTVSLSLLL